MNNELRYNLRKLKLAYYNFRYSQYFPVVMPLSLIMVGLLIFFLFVLPQLQNWFSVQSEIEATQQRITMMQQNTSLLQNLRRSEIDKDFNLAIQALPSDKDFTSILNAIGNAATYSKISLHDYSFTLGKVTTEKNRTIITDSASSPTVQINLIAEGNFDDTANFLKELEQKLPLIEVTSYTFADGQSEIKIQFYIKPLPNLTINNTDPVTTLNQSERQTLDTLRELK